MGVWFNLGSYSTESPGFSKNFDVLVGAIGAGTSSVNVCQFDFAYMYKKMNQR